MAHEHNLTRMHSSRMCTARSSSHPGGSPPGSPWTRHPPGPGTPWTRYPQDQAPPEQAPPRSRPNRDQTPPKQAQTPPDTPRDQAPTWNWHTSPPEQAPPGPDTPPEQEPPLWTEFLTHSCKNITLPQTSFAGGNNRKGRSVFCSKLMT